MPNISESNEGNVSMVEEYKRQLLMLKGERDLRSSIANLVSAQSAMFAFATKHDVTETIKNFREIESDIERVSKESANIKKILQKTRILSINASVEAAHVGNAGKGFGVVADEIGTLANQTEGCTNVVAKISQSLSQKSATGRDSLDKVMRGLQVYNASLDRMMEREKYELTIEDNGFILTTLAKRLEDHAGFMRYVMENGGKLNRVTDHHTCAFGKWYDINREKYLHIPAFADMYETHKSFHSAAIEYNDTLNDDCLSDMISLSSEMLLMFISLIAAFKEEMKSDESFYISAA